MKNLACVISVMKTNSSFYTILRTSFFYMTGGEKKNEFRLRDAFRTSAEFEANLRIIDAAYKSIKCATYGRSM